MGGYSTMTNSPEEFPQDVAQQMRRRGLLPALMGVTPTAATPAGAGRVQDDPVTRNNPEATGAMSSGQAPVGTSPTQRDTLADEMMREYQRLGQQEAPAPQPSLKQQILQSVMRIAPIAAARFAGGPYAAIGAGQGEMGAIQNQQRMTLAQQQMAQQHEQQRNSLRERMLQEMMQNQRMQQQSQQFEERETQRDRLAMQAQAAQGQRLSDQIAARNAEEDKKEALRREEDKQRATQEQSKEELRRSEDIQRENDFNRRMNLETQRIGAIEGRAAKSEDLKTNVEGLKIYQPAMDADFRLKQMRKNEQDALKNNDQQAMLSLLTNHVGMTLGLQKGARITKDILREAQQSAPWLQRVQARFDGQGYLTGAVLTPEQMRQMVMLAEDQRRNAWDRSDSEAQYVGVTKRPRSILEDQGGGQGAQGAGGIQIIRDANGRIIGVK